MAPLSAPHECSPAENLQASWEVTTVSAHSGAKRRRSFWYFGTWNVRSLLDNEGPIETARQGPECHQLSEDRRIDLVVRELNRYRITVAALQETKWFGSATYSVGKSVVLTAGRPTPQAGQSNQRGEGVAIVLSSPAIAAWKTGGEQWKTWGSRLIRVTLATGKRGSDRLHVLSCYAPTFGATRALKDDFFDDLQHALNEIPPEEPYVMLGDFNARVGSRSEESDLWEHVRSEVRGPHGLGQENDAGREFLNFLLRNEATICNTWFQKKSLHKQTWQHPKSKVWHCIDFAIVRQKDRKRCMDATVKRGAECHTDHQLLRVKVKMARKWSHPTTRRKMMRYNVAKLQDRDANSNGESTPSALFQEAASAKAREAWKDSSSAEEKWLVLRSAMIEAAKSELGTDQRRHPDWFRESSELLEPLFLERNQLYTKWLSTGRESDRKRFAGARRRARQAVRAAKNAWFQGKAEEAQRERFGGKKVWQCIRDMQRGRRGLVPTRSATVRDEGGQPCTTITAQHQRWRRHFAGILNIRSQYNLEELRKVGQRPIRPQMDDLPTMEELEQAVGKLRSGKAGGGSGILPEMVKSACCDSDFLDLLLDLVCTVWKEKRVPKEWSDAIIVPIPKKGNLTNCDNWRGIALLDVVGKVAARVIQERLQDLAEEVLPESQCGFRKGRSCADMIFTVRQLVEKSWEHRAKTFLVFVDLRKAYDSIPREALWVALKKLGVPDSMIELIRSFHHNMEARIRLDTTLLEEIEVNNGLRQGCCMAPALFNLYSCLVVERWAARMEGTEGAGVYLRYKHDGRIFRRYTRNAQEMMLTECQFADDAALLATTRAGAVRALREYLQVAEDFGLTVSIPKTKIMAVGREVTEDDRAPLRLDDTSVIEAVSEFPYLGSTIAASGRMDSDVEKRIAQASKAFGALRTPVFRDRDLLLRTKRNIYQACVLSVLLYASECWIPLRKHRRKLDSFHHRCLRTILGISNRQQWAQRITSQEVRRRWGDPATVSEKVTARRLEWLGHLARMPESRTPKRCLFGWLPQPRPRGGPRRRWRDVIRADLQEIRVPEDDWYDLAVRSRRRWRTTCREALDESRATTQQRGASSSTSTLVMCLECGRSFRREGDKKKAQVHLREAKTNQRADRSSAV